MNAASGGFVRGLVARPPGAPAASGPRAVSRQAAQAAPAPARLAHALTRSLGQPLAGGHRVVPLLQAEAAEQAVLQALEQARDHVHLASALRGGTAALERLVARLLACSRAGVRINLLLGGRDARAPWPAELEPLRRAGVTVCAAEAGAARRLGAALGAPERLEMLVVDGRLAIMDDVLPQASPAAACGWQAAALQVEGPVVAQLQSLFVERWRRVADRPMQPGRHFPPLPPLGPQRVGLAACDGGRGRAPLRQALHSALVAAQRRIVLAVRDGDPGPELQDALDAAALRGVRVRVMRPAVGARRPALPASVTLHDRPTALGPAPSNLCVVDGLWCMLGAARLDGRGWLHEASAGLVVLDEAVGARLEALFDGEAARCAAAEATRPRGGRAWISQRLAASP